MKKNLLLIIPLVVVIGVVIWYFVGKNKITEPAETPPSITATFVCENDKTIQVTFIEGESVPVKSGEPPISGNSAKILLSDGRTFDLPQTISASGARFANEDESFVFWNKGDNATILENGEEVDYLNCKTVPQTAE
ncbi:MAG: MliC family protein [Parcubacteria group bacterium]